ncbi:hypothetical protein BBJ28_00014433, partial [Nothophytophthora sp. Chile5]
LAAPQSPLTLQNIPATSRKIPAFLMVKRWVVTFVVFAIGSVSAANLRVDDAELQLRQVSDSDSSSGDGDLQLRQLHDPDSLTAADEPQDSATLTDDWSTLDTADSASEYSSDDGSDLGSEGEVDDTPVKLWGQCGGLYHVGGTDCSDDAICTFLSDSISICFPDSRESDLPRVVRLES